MIMIGLPSWFSTTTLVWSLESRQRMSAEYGPTFSSRATNSSDIPRASARQPLPESNVVSWIARMELDSSAENVSRVAREVLEEYPGPEHATLREAFREWVLGAAESWGIEAEVLEQVKSLKEAEMIYAGVEELKERAHRQGLGEGRAEGHRRGRITLVCRLARRKFGAETAERLSRLLEGITDPDRICRIGDRIIECETGAELLAQARET